jgi:hypothetical protein
VCAWGTYDCHSTSTCAWQQKPSHWNTALNEKPYQNQQQQQQQQRQQQQQQTHTRFPLNDTLQLN